MQSKEQYFNFLYLFIILFCFNGFSQKINQSKQELNKKETNSQNTSQANPNQQSRTNYNDASDNLFFRSFPLPFILCYSRKAFVTKNFSIDSTIL